jgi:hypothetical protein
MKELKKNSFIPAAVTLSDVSEKGVTSTDNRSGIETEIIVTRMTDLVKKLNTLYLNFG